MEYQKIINLLDNTPNQPTKFKTKDWVEINDDSRGMYNTNGWIKFKTLMLSLCDYSDPYIPVSGTKTGAAVPPDKRKNYIIKIRAPFAECIGEINNTQLYNAKYIGIVITMYNLKEYSDNIIKHLEMYGKTTEMNHFR